MLKEDFSLGGFVGFGKMVGLLRKEVPAEGDVSLRPFEIVDLREVFDQILVATEGFLHLTNIDDRGSSHLGPQFLNDAMRDKPGAEHEMVMGVTSLSSFCNSEVLNLSKLLTQSAYEDWNLLASCIKSFSLVVIKGRVNCKGKKTVGAGFRRLV